MTAHHDRPRPVAPAEAAGLPERLAAVLGDLAFPAHRWQVLTTAEMYGVDTVSRALIERLPERRYHSLGELTAVLVAVLCGRPITAIGQAGPPRTPPVAPRRAPAAPARPVRALRPAARPATPGPVPRTPVA